MCYNNVSFLFPVNSAYSVGGTKYDPELLRNEVAVAKQRVTQLHHELAHIKDQVHYKAMGVQALTEYVYKVFI